MKWAAPLWKGPEVNISGRSCQNISKCILYAWKLLLCGGFCDKFFCTLLHIARQRAYVIYETIIYSKRPLLRLRPLPSNNELSAAKAHFRTLWFRPNTYTGCRIASGQIVQSWRGADFNFNCGF